MDDSSEQSATSPVYVLPTLSSCKLQVVGSVSTWIDPDSSDTHLKAQSVTTLRQQLAWAGHLGLQAVLLPPAPQPLRSAHYSQVSLGQ